MENEDYLFASWLCGLHLEDMSKFDESDFQKCNLFRLLKNGWTAAEIPSKSRYSALELTQIIKDYGVEESFYTQTFATELNRKIHHKIKTIVDSNQIPFSKKNDLISELLSETFMQESVPDPERDLSQSFLKEMEIRKNSKYVRYGLPSLDNLTGGIKRKEFVVIGARPSVGKSAFALQLANKFRYLGEKVLFFPLEMSTVQNLSRLLVNDNIIESSRLKSGTLSDKDKEQISEYLNRFDKEGYLKFYENVSALEVIEAIVSKERPYGIIIDQLTQLKSKNANFKSDFEHHQYMTSNLKRIAMEYNTAVILLHQIHRSANEKDVTMADLKGSGSLEEDADVVLLLQRIDKDSFVGKGGNLGVGEVPVKLKLEKHRDGRTGYFIARFNPDRMRFYETDN